MEKTKPSILIVDDEGRTRMVLSQYFAIHGFDVAEARDGREAVDKVKGGQYDVILMDAVMPVMNGIEAIRSIRQDLGKTDVPAVMLTAHGDAAMQKSAAEAGIDEFVSKSADLADILRMVHHVIQSREFVTLKMKHRACLEEEVAAKTVTLQELLSEKENLNREILVRIAVAAEFRDDITGRHTERVGVISSILAGISGMDDAFCSQLRLTAPLHDVGKIGVPDAILLKPGKLDEQEWEIMKKHTTIGGRILGGSRLALLDSAETIALSHHERWDGRGYPKGVSGDAIPLEGRIVSVADTFDAMTTERPYKKPMPFEKARAIINEEAGRQFDPAVVHAFNDGYEKILETVKKINDKI